MIDRPSERRWGVSVGGASLRDSKGEGGLVDERGEGAEGQLNRGPSIPETKPIIRGEPLKLFCVTL